MASTSDTNALDRPKKRDWLNPVPKPNGLKPLSDWLPNGRSERPLSQEYPEFVLGQFYKEDLMNQSPYDADPPTLEPKVFGGNPYYAIDLTDELCPTLEKFSQVALECFNNNMEGASYEFHDLVKCTRWSDRRNPFVDFCPLDPTEYYITFRAKAKAKGDTCSSSSPAITIFEAKVLVDKDDEDKPPVVEECRIKI